MTFLQNHSVHVPELGTVFVCGTDVLASWMRPGVWSDDDLRKILGYGYLAVIARKTDGVSCEEVLENHVIFKTDPSLKSKIVLIEDKLEDNLSSTHVRNLLLAGDSVKYLVPDEVERYLVEENVYTEDSMKINEGSDVFKKLAENEIER